MAELYIHTVMMPFSAQRFTLSAQDFDFALIGALPPSVATNEQTLSDYVPATELMMPATATPRAFIPGPAALRHAAPLTEREASYQFGYPVQYVLVATQSTLDPAITATVLRTVVSYQQIFGDSGIKGYYLNLSDGSTVQVAYSGPAPVTGEFLNRNWPMVLPPYWSVVA